MFKKISQAAEYIEERINIRPEAGIILGTGLGGLAEEIEDAVIIPYNQIPHFPLTTVEGHTGALISGVLSGRRVLAMKGRFHFYEGYPVTDVIFPVMVMHRLGIKMLIVSNASGGLNPEFRIGEMMFIQDHINLIRTINAEAVPAGRTILILRESHSNKRIYDPGMISVAERIARELGINYHKGTYACVSGPTFETPAEYKYVRYLGADAVGMSTVPEAVAAAGLGLAVFAISVISDLGVEGKIVEISHKEVIDAASLVEPDMTRLIKALILDLKF